MTSISALETPAKTVSGVVSELITEARIDALNRSLAEQGLEASQIISILELPAQPIANTVPARFRVLYRTL